MQPVAPPPAPPPASPPVVPRSGQPAVFSSVSAGHILDLVGRQTQETQQQAKQSLQYFQYLRGYDI